MPHSPILSLLLSHGTIFATTNFSDEHINCVISGFRRDLDGICSLLGCYAALGGGFIPTFRDNLSVPSTRVKKSKKGFLFGLLDP
jgi:hypothetical protein